MKRIPSVLFGRQQLRYYYGGRNYRNRIMSHSPEAWESVSGPDSWEDTLELLTAHEERIHGKGVVNGFIRMNEVMSQATDNSLIRVMVVPYTGDYPIFDGILQRREYMWRLMREIYKDDEQSTLEAMALRLARQKLLRQKEVKLEAIVSQQSLQQPPWLGLAAMHDQINYLIEVADDPNMNLRLLPEEVPDGLHDVTLIYLNGPASREHNYGFTLTSPYIGEIMVDSCSIPTIESFWNMASGNSLSEKESRGILIDKAKELGRDLT